MPIFVFCNFKLIVEMIIKAKHHRVIFPLFQHLGRTLIRQSFNSVNIYGDFIDNRKAILVIANHMSWWDGFWIEYLNHKVFHRKFHFMMLEEQLIKHWYFQYTGGFSVKKKSRTMTESINYTIELLQNPENMVLMFPQGKIHSMHVDYTNFEKGIEKIIENIAPDLQVILVVNMIDYFSNKKPNLYIYFKSYMAKDLQKFDIENKYNDFYKETLNQHKTKTS
ncbi:MAG: 1-acyl-sn-glycerol-3-phosphate acyltransferase [Bacteroidales bacterium]